MESIISTIGVVGAGQMGHGIAQVAAMSGFGVYLNDRDPEALESALQSIESSLDKLVQAIPAGKLDHGLMPPITE